LRDLVDKVGDAVLPLRLDVTDHDAAARAVAQAGETFGRIDIVINNAGYADLGSFEDTTIDSFRAQIDTDFYGVVNVSNAVVPILREQGTGHIFQISSLIVRLSGPGLTAYQAAKCAVGLLPRSRPRDRSVRVGPRRPRRRSSRSPAAP
jgi:NAD(P)-dependent dehydrogenase (short-subunit alcohol dehydrogenase family)